MRFTPTQKQRSIFTLAATAFEKLGANTSSALEHLGCETLQLDGRRGHVKYIQEMFSREGKCDLNAEHRIAMRAALELHKREAKSAEKKLEQLEMDVGEPETRIEEIEQFISDIDEQLEFSPDSEDDAPGVSLDDHIREHGDPSETQDLPEMPDTDSRDGSRDDGEPHNPGAMWQDGPRGRTWLRMRDGSKTDISNMSDKERKNLRRSQVRKSRAK